jgi:dTDP-4-amino-4,6-dideoxygalactose transaminase
MNGRAVDTEFQTFSLNPTILQVPKLPVADWDALIGRASSAVPAITDLPHVLLTTSGRAAIGLALEELGIGAGDQVLVPTYHCPTMVSPVVAAGARPVFYAIDAMGLPAIEALERLDLQRIKAMIAVHYFGIPRCLGAARALCDRLGIALIEDCAHAFFGSVGGVGVGTTGDFAVASLTKFLPVPEGGCLASQTRPIRHHMLRPRGGMANLRKLVDTFERGANFDRFEPIGFALRSLFAAKNFLRGRRREAGPNPAASASEANRDAAMPAYDADLAHRAPARVVLMIQRHADRGRIRSRRRANYELLSTLLGNVAGARVLEPRLPAEAVPYVFPLWVDEPERSYQALRGAGVPIFRWDVLWPGVPALAGDHGLRWAHHVFQLGCHQDLSEREVRQIASTVEALIDSRP